MGGTADVLDQAFFFCFESTFVRSSRGHYSLELVEVQYAPHVIELDLLSFKFLELVFYTLPHIIGFGIGGDVRLRGDIEIFLFFFWKRG